MAAKSSTSLVLVFMPDSMQGCRLNINRPLSAFMGAVIMNGSNRARGWTYHKVQSQKELGSHIEILKNIVNSHETVQCEDDGFLSLPLMSGQSLS